MSLANHSDAVVVRIEPGLAWVRTEGRQKACGACESKDGCAIAGTGELLNGQGDGQLLCLANTIHAQPGDHVLVQIEGGAVWRAAWRAYGLPLLLALLAAMLLKYLTGSELWAGAGVLLGLLAGFYRLKGRGLVSGPSSPILTLKFKRSSHHFIARS